MLRYAWIRIQRKPLIFVAISLFTSIIALTLCGLHSGNDAALEQYNDIYYKIDVRCTVTNLAGDQSDRLNIRTGTISRFTGTSPYVPTDLSDLLEDVQIKGSMEIVWNQETYTLTGITATDIEPKLWPENGCTIFWNENADQSIFASSEMACIIPQALLKELQEAELSTDEFPLYISSVYPQESGYDASLTILGTYHGTNEKTIYCPWETYVLILNAMGQSETAEAMYATLRNNNDLPLLREVASRYFAQPDPHDAGVEMEGDHYLALDINDSQLSQARTNLENSMIVNRVAAALVLALSAAAGAFIGFLMIRNRKKEISLMRTMGTPNSRIFIGFVTEQLVFVLVGAIVGGSKFLWNPASWLVLFVCVYFTGLSAALLVMLSKKLLTIIKEDE